LWLQLDNCKSHSTGTHVLCLTLWLRHQFISATALCKYMDYSVADEAMNFSNIEKLLPTPEDHANSLVFELCLNHHLSPQEQNITPSPSHHSALTTIPDSVTVRHSHSDQQHCTKISVYYACDVHTHTAYSIIFTL